MLNGDQSVLYSALQLPALFQADESCKFIALKVKLEANNTALHVIYIEKQVGDLPFCALVTVTEWDGNSDREEFFIEAENAEQLIEKLQRFDEINNFIFVQAPNTLTIDTVNMKPQAMFCTLFPELGRYNPDASKEVLFGLKNSSLALLNRLESSEKKS